MAEKTNVPEIRFAGFTDPWEQRKLGNCGTTYSGLSGKTKEDFGHGSARFVPYTNVFDNPLTDTKRLEAVEIDSSQNKIAYGDVFFTVSSETPDEVGMSSVWLSDQEDVYLNSFCFGYRQDSTFDSHYLAYMLRSSSIRSNLALLAQGISRFNISKNKVMELSVPVPSAVEQKQIGQYFARLDNLITLHQRKYDKLCAVKKSMLDKMFPKPGETEPEIRFAGFTDPWEQRKFSELASLRRGLTYSPVDIRPYGQGIRVLRSSNIDEDEFTLSNEDVFVDETVVGIELVQEGEILITAANGSPRLVGKRAIIDGLTGKTVHGGFMLCAHAEHPDYVAALMGSRWYQHFLATGVAGGNGSIGNLDKAALEDEYAFVPSIREQELIGALFSRLSDLITLHQRELNLLKNTKKSLLDKMFV